MKDLKTEINLYNEALQEDTVYKIPNKWLYKFYKDFATSLSSLFTTDGAETISINGKKHKISEDYTFEIRTDYYIS